MTEPLFHDFDPVSEKQWKQHIQYHLDGADYNTALVWQSPEGIPVKPFYHPDTAPTPIEGPITKASQFKICSTITVNDNPQQANSNALAALKAGADSIKFIIPNTNIATDILLKDINLNTHNVFLQHDFLTESLITSAAQIKPQAAPFYTTDIIGHLAQSGNWYSNLKTDFSNFDALLSTTNCFSINAGLYQNAGAHMVQQLAYAMCHANEYFNHIEQQHTPKYVLPITAIFNIAIGSNYFFEIAKLKALRLLFNSISKAYSNTYNCHIFATPTKRNKTIYDGHLNLVRSTTESMSAILGGADTISNLAYDALWQSPNAFGDRIARNQLLILKSESHFNIVDNPTDGSYYIDSLTAQFAEKALILFKDIEANGGFLKQLKAGTIQRKIKESAHEESSQFASGSKISVGINAYTNPEERVKATLELFPFTKTHKRKTLIAPIIEKRLTQNSEYKRLKKE